MQNKKRPERVLRDAKNILEDCLREGYFPPDIPQRGRGAVTEAGQRLADKYGVPTSTARDWILAARDTEEWAIDWTLFRPYQYSALVKDAYRPSNVNKPEGDLIRVGMIGDLHDAPSLPDKSRFQWMGKWVADNDFDVLVQIGDWASLDSLSKHCAPGTKTFADLPSYRADLESLDESLNYFDMGLDGWSGKRILTKGNHEGRADRYEDTVPQMQGMVVSQLDDVFRSHKWRIIPFGEITFLEGIGFTHTPISGMGKPYGGVTSDHRAGKDSVFSLFHGHSHQRVIAPSAKIGPMGSVDLISIGCGLPSGHIEDYAKHNTTSWWWGVCSATLHGGRILDMNFVSMDSLERKYG